MDRYKIYATILIKRLSRNVVEYELYRSLAIDSGNNNIQLADKCTMRNKHRKRPVNAISDFLKNISM
jgi:hypothetical protein